MSNTLFLQKDPFDECYNLFVGEEGSPQVIPVCNIQLIDQYLSVNNTHGFPQKLKPKLDDHLLGMDIPSLKSGTIRRMISFSQQEIDEIFNGILNAHPQYREEFE